MLNTLYTRSILSRISINLINTPYPQCASINLARRFKYTMSAELSAQLSKLNIEKVDVVDHEQVAGAAEWKAELEKAGRKDLGMTKTVSLPASPRSSILVKGQSLHTSAPIQTQNS